MRVHKLGIPTDSRQGFALLVQAGMLDADLAIGLTAMVGFRNVAVHNYRDMDIEIVRQILAGRLVDLKAFSIQLVSRALP